MRKNKKIIVLATILLISLIGVLITNHLKDHQEKAFDLKEYEATLQELNELEKDREKLETDYQQMRENLDQIWYELLASDEQSDTDLLEQLTAMRKYAGLTDVQGPGLVVSLNDKLNYDPNLDGIGSIIHDQNLIYLLNLLIDHGAQAISVNNLRIVNSSNIFCVGTTILCNNQRMTPPYIVRVIGPEAEMQSALQKDPVFTSLTAPPYEIRMEIKTESELLIRSYETPATIDADISLLKNNPSN